MKQYLLNIIAAITFTATAVAGAIPSSSLNVRDFGAKGDGVTDDTEAIQKAVNQAAKQTQAYARMWGASYPEIVFPAGNYLISKTIVLATGLVPNGGIVNGRPTNNGFSRGMGFGYVRGEGQATIRQRNPAADIFYVGMAYKVTIEDLNFDGGRHAINMWTGNQDCAMPIIRRCRFSNTSDYAIQTPYITRGEKGEFYGYSVCMPDGTMKDVTAPDAKHFLYHSTYLHVSECEFNNCRKVLFTVADMALMENCRISTDPAMQGAAIRTAGLLKLANITGLANVTPGKEQRWIDVDFGCTSWVIGENLKLTTAGDQGMCVVYTLDKFRRSGAYNPGGVVLQNSEFKVAGAPENAVIFCREVPNMLVISNCRQTGKNPTPALGFAKVPDSVYFTGPNPNKPLIVTNGLGYMVNDRNQNIIADLPAAMVPYQRQGMPTEAIDQIGQLRTLIDSNTTTLKDFSGVTKTIKAADCGLVGDGVTDDGPALQKIFSAIPDDGLTEVIFPSAVYFFNQVINVPSNIIIRGMGRTVFLAPDQSQAGFRVGQTRKLAVLNCSFESGGKQWELQIPTGTTANILFDNCVFANSSTTAVTCRSSEQTFKARTASRARITNSMFYNNRAVMDNNISAIIDSCWMAGYGHSFKEGINLKSKRGWEGANYRKELPDTDPIRNIPDIRNDGIICADNILGVPMGKGWGRQFRWVDNSGIMLCDYFRFGGEQGGRPAVRVLPPADGAPMPVVAITNSWLHHMTGAHHFPNRPEAMSPSSYMVYCQTAPGLIALSNNFGMETSYPPHGIIGATIQAASETLLNNVRQHLFMSCNLIPEDWGIRAQP